MSASNLQASLKNLSTSYNSTQRNAGDKLKHENAFWVNYSVESQQEEIKKARGANVQDFLGKIKALKSDLAGERKRIPLEVGKIKYPGLVSRENSEKAIAETQINTALLYLSTPHSSEAITHAIKNALDLGRREFAFSLMDNVRLGIPKDISGQDKPSEAQKLLLASIADLEENFVDKPKLDELEKESQDLSTVERTAREIEKYISSGHQKEFFTREEVEAMPQNQVTANILAVNESMQVWEGR